MIRAFTLLLLLLSGQLDAQKVPPGIIHIPDLIDKKIELNLSDLCPDIFYTVLETTKESYIGTVGYLFMDQNLILVYDSQSHKLLRFTKDGRFAGEFMSQGKGPGEYVDISSIDGNGRGELLIMRDAAYIDILNYEGKRLKTIRLSWTPRVVRWVNPQVIALFYPNPAFYRNEGFEVTFMDLDGKVLSRGLKHSMKDTGTGLGTYTICQRNKGSLYYWNPQTDTVYTISPSAEIHPRYIFTHDRRHSDAMKNRSETYAPSLDGMYLVDAYCEWGDYLFVSGANNRLVYRGLFNKKKKIGGDVNYNHYSKLTWHGLFNDVDGGMHFWPGQNQPDGSLAKVWNADQLLEIYEHNKTIGIKIDPGRRSRFEQEVIGRITKSSNPVIMRMISKD